MKIRIYDIPESIKKSNRIEFNHESNEYIVNSGAFFNIPSDGVMWKYIDTETVTIELDCCSISLYENILPGITFYDYINRC
ncbi:MAG: hypothetical protein PHP08_00865 [Candidatus Dojkabacteria bacterium]|nr:hypothetical protein [Candidatus Dojkabacteria bacterium]